MNKIMIIIITNKIGKQSNNDKQLSELKFINFYIKIKEKKTKRMSQFTYR